MRTLSYTIGALGLLACIVLAVMARTEGKDPYEIAAIVGSVASLFGLIVALIQLYSIKKITIAAELAAQDARNRVIQGISRSDASRAIKLIEEIRVHSVNRDHKLTWIRSQDLHLLLLQFKGNRDLKRLGNVKKFEAQVQAIGVEVNNLEGVASGEIENFDPSDLQRALNRILGILTDLESQLKYN